MIKVVTIIIVVNINILFLIRVWIVNHFGRNPKRGGSPIRDKKFRLKVKFTIGEFLIRNNWFR